MVAKIKDIFGIINNIYITYVDSGSFESI